MQGYSSFWKIRVATLAVELKIKSQPISPKLLLSPYTLVEAEKTSKKMETDKTIDQRIFETVEICRCRTLGQIPRGVNARAGCQNYFGRFGDRRLRKESLVSDVVDGEQRADRHERRVVDERAAEIGGNQPCLPIVAMQDVGAEVL